MVDMPLNPNQTKPNHKYIQSLNDIKHYLGSARGVMVIVVGNGHCDMSSNPGRDWLHFT